MRDQTDFKILEFWNEGKTVEDMCKIEPSFKKATVYRRIEKMKKGKESFVFRVHDQPDEEKLKTCKRL